jgi:hypothetical protein
MVPEQASEWIDRSFIQVWENFHYCYCPYQYKLISIIT